MFLNLFFLVLFVAIGLAIGLAVLPWRKKIGDASVFEFLRGFVLFWPFFLVHFFLIGCKAYVAAWKHYLRSRRLEQSNDSDQQHRR